MKRIAILGGGIAGLSAAYELELARKHGAEIDWHLYESTGRLGGIVETTRITTAAGDFILEGGPDAWVSDKPWARDLAIELGLESDLIFSNDAIRKTFIWIDSATANQEGGVLQPMPDHMRMMVPEDLSTLDSSPLFTESARAAYAAEVTRADELKASALPPGTDESVATFVRRHFGDEVLDKIAAPLLSGVFGGDVNKLSVRAVMAPFVAMEHEHGSLILALQARSRARGDKPRLAIFTTLKRGMASLTEALVATLPPDRLHRNNPAISLKREGKLWCLRFAKPAENGHVGKSKKHFNHVMISTSVDSARDLLLPIDAEAAGLLPTEASSAVLATFCWTADTAATFIIPPGFGFLVPPSTTRSNQEPSLLACTFADQKFPHRAPSGARIIRAFFGGDSATTLGPQPDAAIAASALAQLTKILGPLPQPDPTLTTIRRWPRSLPQYELGHLDRMAELDARVSTAANLTLLGNAYRGVGLPDLIHAARTAARALTTNR
jgi:oxygen-dependent protoporphyrinogen oxidase